MVGRWAVAQHDVPPDVAVDLRIGSQIGHYLSAGRPASPEVRDQMVEIILDGLRRRDR